MSTAQRMKGKPSLDEFRSGGGDVPAEALAAEAASVPPAPAVAAAPPAAQVPAVPALAPSPAAVTTPTASNVESHARENKTIRLRKSFFKRLKSDAFYRSNAEGRRVTESDIIDEALELYFRTHPPA